MNPNFAQDNQGRLLAVLDDANVTLNVKTDGNTVAAEIAHPIADLGGQDAVVVAVAQGTVEVSNTVNVEVQNFPADPASGTNQITVIGKLDDVLTKLNGGLPNALINGLLGVQEANSLLIFGEVSQINGKLPGALIDGRLAVDETNSSVIYNRLDLINSKTPALVSGRVPVDGSGVTQPVSNAALTSIDTKTLSPLGSAFSVATESVTTSAGQLPNQSYSRGFAIQNLDSSTPIYVGPTNSVTSSNGWRIAAGEKEIFNLPNSNLLYAISGTGTVSIRIGAVT